VLMRSGAPSFVPFSRENKEPLPPTAHMAQLEQIGKLRAKDVKPGTELRITVSPEDDLYLRAHSRIPDTFATAEIFGMELVLGHEYKIQRGTSIAIFSWHGCTIEMRGPTTMEYDASNHVMADYVNLAGIIEQKRQRAEDENQSYLAAPRVLITGSDYSGKSTLALFLSNMALRKHRRPIMVELDPGSLSCHRQLPSLPGSISALHIDQTAYELNQEPVHVGRLNLHKGIDQGAPAAHLNPNYPIGKSVSFWVGSEDWRSDAAIFWKCMAQLSCLVNAREEVVDSTNGTTTVQADGVKLENVTKGGLIVNAPKNPTNELIDEIVKLFKINMIVVIDDEAKFHYCINKYGGDIPEPSDPSLTDEKNALIYLDAIEAGEEVKVEVVHLAKAGAVIPANSGDDRNRILHMKFADYFHGPERDMVCHNFAIPFRELLICRVVAAPPAQVAASDGWRSRFALKPFDESPSRLRHSVLALVLAPSFEEVIQSTVTGLVWVRDVQDPEDPVNAVLHVMCTSAGPLASNYLLHGDLDLLKYYEK
jgi:polyribonucleotide 5'-hydroxyl-kinase